MESPSQIEPCENVVDVEIGRGPVGIMDEVLIATEAFSASDIKLAMQSGLEAFLGGKLAVSASGKLPDTWGYIKSR